MYMFLLLACIPPHGHCSTGVGDPPGGGAGGKEERGRRTWCLQAYPPGAQRALTDDPTRCTPKGLGSRRHCATLDAVSPNVGECFAVPSYGMILWICMHVLVTWRCSVGVTPLTQECAAPHRGSRSVPVNAQVKSAWLHRHSHGSMPQTHPSSLPPEAMTMKWEVHINPLRVPACPADASSWSSHGPLSLLE